jgi:hypothetical protein
MNPRTSILKHPLGIEISTPLLIPSYSSKGFAMHDGKSELCNIMIFTKEFIYETQLLSAYDIYYRHMLDTMELNPTQLTIIDSGGYETSNNFDLSETRKYDRSKKDWSKELFNEVLDNWTELYPAIVVSYDAVELKIPIKEQVKNALNFFNSKTQFLTDFLIKPIEIESNFIDINEVLKNTTSFADFNIIGVTEKELGDSYFTRMKNIYLLRNELDKNNISSPIHVFGALDPLSVILYFIMGAEIFDGLSWLKYDYYNCCASYVNNSSILKNIESVYLSDNEIRMQTIKDNIYQLETLKNILIDFSQNKDYGIFDKFSGIGFGSMINEIIQNTLKKF